MTCKHKTDLGYVCILCQSEIIEKLQAQLVEAEKVIDFYGDKDNWMEIVFEGELRDSRVQEGDSADALVAPENGIERAREYNKKHRREG